MLTFDNGAGEAGEAGDVFSHTRGNSLPRDVQNTFTTLLRRLIAAIQWSGVPPPPEKCPLQDKFLATLLQGSSPPSQRSTIAKILNLILTLFLILTITLTLGSLRWRPFAMAGCPFNNATAVTRIPAGVISTNNDLNDDGYPVYYSSNCYSALVYLVPLSKSSSKERKLETVRSCTCVFELEVIMCSSAGISRFTCK